jgi:hypothetical protein
MLLWTSDILIVAGRSAQFIFVLKMDDFIKTYVAATAKVMMETQVVSCFQPVQSYHNKLRNA